MATVYLDLVPHGADFAFTRRIALVPGSDERTQIGRYLADVPQNDKDCVFVDARTMSRQHAVVWADENRKVLIQDTKSSNRTYLNSQRLSEEKQESTPFELKSGDLLDFGMDIFGDFDPHTQTNTVLHSKVSTKVVVDSTRARM
ncbi:Glycosyltransferase family 69 protein [Mycena kentingensis (nom. inval.)]|nr:Glycosyltransferase family 69 protein [Mycena kentingensis (nom. inval.)]